MLATHILLQLKSSPEQVDGDCSKLYGHPMLLWAFSVTTRLRELFYTFHQYLHIRAANRNTI